MATHSPPSVMVAGAVPRSRELTGTVGRAGRALAAAAAAATACCCCCC